MAQTVNVESPIRTIGSVQGRIEPEPSLPPGQFVLHATVWGGDVICILAPDRQDLLDGAWGRRAYVAGRVTREAGTSRPLAIDDVTEITLLPEVAPGALLAIGGIAPAPPGAPLPEEHIRELRDE